MQRRPIVKIKPVRGSGRLRAVVRFVGPAERVIERTYEVEIPAGKREQEALKARLRRTVGRELTDASARFREGVATESDLVLLLSYNVVRDVEVGSGAGAAVVPIAGGLTVGQAVEGYYRTEMPSRKSATQDQREGTLGRFLKFLEMGRGGGLGRATPVGEAFRSGVLQAFREWRTGRIAESKVKTTGARAHNEDRKALSCLERWVLQNHPTALPGQVVPWALPAMKEARRRRMLPTDAQVAALVNAAESFVNPERWSPVRWGVVTRLLVEGGLRRDEMCWLQWGDVATGDLEHATVTIQAKAGWSPKSYASRVVPLRRETAEALAEWRRSLPADLAGAASFLMVHGKKRPHRYGGWPRKCWAAICDAAEVHVQPHALRHLCTVRLFRAHLDPASIRDIMGHADVETTIGVYMRWAPEDHMERAWAALPAAIQGQAS